MDDRNAPATKGHIADLRTELKGDIERFRAEAQESSEQLRAEVNHGYNALTGDYEDLVKAGVIDPAKVTRFALQNAASIAALMLTTEALVSETPEQSEDAEGGGH